MRAANVFVEKRILIMILSPFRNLSIRMTFLLTNPVSDLVNPDCYNFRFSGNENLKNGLSNNAKGPGNHFFFFSKQTWRA